MTTSLYQNGLSSGPAVSASLAAIAATGRSIVLPLNEVIEVAFVADSAAHGEDMTHAGIELDVVAPAVPQVACISQKVVHLIGHVRIELQLVEVEVHPAALPMVRV